MRSVRFHTALWSYAWLPAVLALALLGGCERPLGDDVVAMVEDTPITYADVSELYASMLMGAGLNADDPAMRDEVVQSLIHRQLLIEAALDDGIEDTDAYRQALERIRLKAAIDHYTARNLFDTLRVTDGQLRELFAQANTTYEARHLYARTEQEAQALYQRLQNGETFEALAREVFADPELATTGGYLGEFEHDEMDPALEHAAFRLPIGQISQPIRTAQGYSLLRVERRVTTPMLTEIEFAQKGPQLERYEMRRRRIDAQFAHSRQVRDALNPQYADGALEALAASLQNPQALDGEAQQAWEARPLVTVQPSEGGPKTWTFADFAQATTMITPEQRAAVRDLYSLQDLIEGLLVRQELHARAVRQGLDRGAEYDAVVAREIGDWIFEHAKRRLRQSAQPPDDSLRAHFVKNESLYVMPERVRVHEIMVGTNREAQALKAQLQAGADFEALARAHSIRPGAAATGGDLGLVPRDELGQLADPIFAARPGQLLGPFEVQGHYFLIRPGERERPRPMRFEEARGRISQQIEGDFAASYLYRYLDTLKQRYRVRTNPEALARVRLLTPATP